MHVDLKCADCGLHLGGWELRGARQEIEIHACFHRRQGYNKTMKGRDTGGKIERRANMLDTNKKLIDDFLDYLLKERYLSEHTVLAYRKDLEQFCLALPKLTELQNVKSISIRSYLSILNRKYSSSTARRKITAIRTFYKYLVKQSIIPFSPASGIKMPKLKKKPPLVLSHEEVKRLLNTPPANTFLGARDRAIMELIYNSGLRVNEVANLTIEGIDSFAFIPAFYIEKRRDWLLIRNIEDPGWLFPNRFGGKLSTRSIRRKFDKYVKIAGLNPAISPHTLRHTFAQHCIEAGSDIKVVSTALGHKNVSTTKAMYALHHNGTGYEQKKELVTA